MTRLKSIFAGSAARRVGKAAGIRTAGYVYILQERISNNQQLVYWSYKRCGEKDP